jgi:hypothetical protein
VAEIKNFARRILEKCDRRKKEPVNRKSREVCCEDKTDNEPCFQQLILWTLPLLGKMPQAI